MDRRSVVAASALTVLFSTQALPANATEVALLWRPDGASTSSPARVQSSLQAASGSTVTAKKLDGDVARVIDFPGWRGTSPGDVLSPTASMLSTDPAFESDPDGGKDGSSTDFDPESASFAVSVWVKPTHAALFPRGTLKPSAVSPNIVQKGRINEVGGYWKLSIEMTRTSAGLRWAPLCTFRSATGELLNVNASALDQLAMADQTIGYTIGCTLSQGTATLTMTPDGGVAQTRSLVATGPFTISNDESVSVGHKPKTTSATDMYDGLLARLMVAKS